MGLWNEKRKLYGELLNVPFFPRENKEKESSCNHLGSLRTWGVITHSWCMGLGAKDSCEMCSTLTSKSIICGQTSDFPLCSNCFWANHSAILIINLLISKIVEHPRGVLEGLNDVIKLQECHCICKYSVYIKDSDPYIYILKFSCCQKLRCTSHFLDD